MKRWQNARNATTCDKETKGTRGIQRRAIYRWLLTIHSVQGNTSRPSASDWQLRSRTLNFASSSSLTSPHDFFNSPTTFNQKRMRHLTTLKACQRRPRAGPLIPSTTKVTDLDLATVKGRERHQLMRLLQELLFGRAHFELHYARFRAGAGGRWGGILLRRTGKGPP